MEKVIEIDIDIEEYAKAGKPVPPHAHRYRFRVDRDYFTTTKHKLPGREILIIAGKIPPERFALRQRHHGGQVTSVGLEDTVDLTTPGIERFTTIPRDQTEGTTHVG
jgi:hypothetical protein